jgi:hypothetical protein
VCSYFVPYQQIRQAGGDKGKGFEMLSRCPTAPQIFMTGSIRLLPYFIDWTGGEMAPTDHQDCRWVSFDELADYEFTPADIPFVRQLQKAYQET